MNEKIQCPNCGHKFDIEEALSDKLKAHLEKEYEQRLNKEVKKINSEKQKLQVERDNLELEKEKHDEILKKELNKLFMKEKRKLEKNIGEEYEEKLNALEEENRIKKAENKKLKQKEIELLRKEQEISELEEELRLTLEKEMLEKQKKIEENARAKERENFELEKIKLLKQIEDNKKLAEEMKRKAEQGSMQLQGEVQELAIEELLERSYPYDKIEEVPKGIKGADCIQTVVNSVQQECGKIVYESKRTKNFSNGWIDKLKQDQLKCKADIAVLVTQTMPNDIERFGEKNGIWICGFQELNSLSFVLREMLIKTHAVKTVQVNKGDKMELLYNYLTSSEFVQNIKRIVENYDAMLEQLNSEKKAMHKIWATREKQIWVVQENISALFGSIKGIAGNELATGKVLELPNKTKGK